MADPNGDHHAGGERIKVEGIAGGLSLGALRSLLDPTSREAATIDLDLSQIQVTIPAAALYEIVAQVMAQGSIDLRDDGITIRQGGGSPAIHIGIPVAGVRVRTGSAGIHVVTD